jgi:hypothetical protein
VDSENATSEQVDKSTSDETGEKVSIEFTPVLMQVIPGISGAPHGV